MDLPKHVSQEIKTAAAAAVMCQNACNFSGVLFSFAKHMQTLCDEQLDTLGKAQHPVTIMFMDKLVSLTQRGYIRYNHSDTYTEAYKWCQATGSELIPEEQR